MGAVMAECMPRKVFVYLYRNALSTKKSSIIYCCGLVYFFSINKCSRYRYCPHIIVMSLKRTERPVARPKLGHLQVWVTVTSNHSSLLTKPLTRVLRSEVLVILKIPTDIYTTIILTTSAHRPSVDSLWKNHFCKKTEAGNKYKANEVWYSLRRVTNMASMCLLIAEVGSTTIIHMARIQVVAHTCYYTNYGLNRWIVPISVERVREKSRLRPLWVV